MPPWDSTVFSWPRGGCAARLEGVPAREDNNRLRHIRRGLLFYRLAKALLNILTALEMLTILTTT